MRSCWHSLFLLFSCVFVFVNGARISINATTSNASSSADSTRSYGVSSTSTRLALSNDTTSLNCSGSWSAWFSNSIAYTDATTYTKTFTYYNITASTTTLCDGHPRVIGGSAALTTVASGINSTLTSEFLNYTVPTPTCQLSPQECSGPLWGVSSCTSIRSISDCGPCTIYGQSVDLKYFPVTSNASRDLCPATGAGSPTVCPLAPTRGVYTVTDPYQAPPCDYITANVTAAKPSGPYIISAGQTFYHNRVYFSLDTVYASNTCGPVGSTHTNAIISVLSSEVHSVGGYHHGFADIGYQVNFQDFTSVPAYAYYMNDDIIGPSYGLALTDRYRFGTDFINGISTADFGGAEAGAHGYTGSQVSWIWDEAYAPTLLMPLQIRSLDPAWASCSLNLVGLHDPPIALTQQLTYAGPTTPDAPKTTAAPAPASTPRSDGAPATADPKPTGSGQSGPEYAAPTYTYDPLPTPSPSGDSSEDVQPRPTGEDESPSPGTNRPSAASPSPQPSPESVEPPEPEDPAPDPLPSGHDPISGVPPASPYSPSGAGATQEADPPPTTRTTPGVGDVLASLLSALPIPTTTTNALGVLESATQTFEGGTSGPTATSPPEIPEQTPRPQQLPEPLTFSDDGETHTLQPLPGSAADGLYTLAPSPPADTPPAATSPSHPPATPIILSTDGSKQTLQPVHGSSGLYTLISPSPSLTPDNIPRPTESPAIPAVPFTGPATFVAGDGATHAISPVRGTSGVFVVDGERTVTQVVSASARRSGTTAMASGSAVDGDEAGVSVTMGSGDAGLLPDVVTASGAGGSTAAGAGASASASGDGGDGGAGGGGRGGSTPSPPPNGVGRLHALRSRGGRVFACALGVWIVMFY